jgi:hypothetical protein
MKYGESRSAFKQARVGNWPRGMTGPVAPARGLRPLAFSPGLPSDAVTLPRTESFPAPVHRVGNKSDNSQ